MKRVTRATFGLAGAVAAAAAAFFGFGVGVDGYPGPVMRDPLSLLALSSP